MSTLKPLRRRSVGTERYEPTLSKMKHHPETPSTCAVQIVCPHCSTMGAFPSKAAVSVKEKWGQYVLDYVLSIRFCPNPYCSGPVFTATNALDVYYVFPRTRLPFDTSKLPDEVLGCIKEAVTCHAEGCYRAAALMVRRSLEELCKHQGAAGPNLKKRIEALGEKIMVPKELLSAADELRLLGNDAAHVEAQEYSEIGAVEVELAIRLTQELVKAVYQHEDLLGRLRALKSPAAE